MRSVSWATFLRLVLAGLALGLGLTIAVIALVDPLGVSPIRVVSDEHLPQTNRRYIVPTIVRSGRYDSFVVGTSTVHSLDPRQASSLLGGNFANLTLFDSTPYEQAAVVRLLRNARPRTLVWGLDINRWCVAEKLPDYLPHVGEFPNWLYDDNRWNDFAYLLNVGVLDLVRLKLRAIYWRGQGQSRADGYQPLLPPDLTYDLAKVQADLYQGRAPKLLPQRTPSGGAVRELSEMPNLRFLVSARQSLPASTNVMLVLMPAHAIALPEADSDG